MKTGGHGPKRSAGIGAWARWCNAAFGLPSLPHPETRSASRGNAGLTMLPLPPLRRPGRETLDGLPRRWSMTKSDRNRSDLASAKTDALDDMSEGEFVKRWKAIVGEPPAVMLSSRADMVRVLVESARIETTARGDASVHDRTDSRAQASSGATILSGFR